MKIKKFLKKNEIYFNTVTSLLLGLMAIIVAFNSNKIAQEQTKMNYYENSPDFHLSREYIRDSTGYAKELAITVDKFGGKAKNISISIESYAHFEITDKEYNELSKYVHLLDYFDESYRTGENIGNIRLIKGFNNNKYFSEFKRLMEIELKKSYKYVFINDLIIAKVNYTDFLNENKEEYYDISFGDGILLKENDFRIKLFKELKFSAESIPITKTEEDNIEKYLKIVLKEKL